MTEESAARRVGVSVNYTSLSYTRYSNHRPVAITEPFMVHASFSSVTPRKLLQLVASEVKAAGGIFTGAHVANQANWHKVWRGKLRNADRVIVFYGPEYRKRFTFALKWEASQIHGGVQEICEGNDPAARTVIQFEAARNPVFFADDRILADPSELRAWLTQVDRKDRRYPASETFLGHGLCDHDRFNEFHEFTTDARNLLTNNDATSWVDSATSAELTTTGVSCRS